MICIFNIKKFLKKSNRIDVIHINVVQHHTISYVPPKLNIKCDNEEASICLTWPYVKHGLMFSIFLCQL